jgi:hypothetical protein
MDDAAGTQVDDEEEEDRAEKEVVALDEIAGPDVLGVILDEGGPGLAARLASAGPHVLLDRSPAHADANLEQLATDALGSPEMIPGGLAPVADPNPVEVVGPGGWPLPDDDPATSHAHEGASRRSGPGPFVA